MNDKKDKNDIQTAIEKMEEESRILNEKKARVLKHIKKQKFPSEPSRDEKAEKKAKEYKKEFIGEMKEYVIFLYLGAISGIFITAYLLPGDVNKTALILVGLLVVGYIISAKIKK